MREAGNSFVAEGINAASVRWFPAGSRREKGGISSCPEMPPLMLFSERSVLERLRRLAVDQVEPVGVHHLGPRRDEVLHELLLGVLAPIDFGESAKLRVRTEDQVDTGSRPLRRLGL